MNNPTIERLRKNPHYKPTPGQLGPDPLPEEEEPIRTFGVVPKTNDVPEKHPTDPKKLTHKKKIDKDVS